MRGAHKILSRQRIGPSGHRLGGTAQSHQHRELCPPHRRNSRPGRRPEKMNPYRLARRAAGRILRSIPWTRRWLMLSPDYTVLTMEEARRRQQDGWHSRRVAARQDTAYRSLLEAMHAGNPRIDLSVA